MFTRDADGVFRAVSFSGIQGLLHGFGTRSAQHWHGDLPTAVVRQVHSSRVLAVDAPGAYGEADALVTQRPGFLLTIRTADCVPALVVDPRTHSVAGVHAGWRGTASEILPRTISVMESQYGTRPADVLIALGPAIGQCCFEVGPEVVARFRPWLPKGTDKQAKAKIDLREIIIRQLSAAGVAFQAITAIDECTRCNPDRFHSWRRDAERSGRMVSGIGWEF